MKRKIEDPDGRYVLINGDCIEEMRSLVESGTRVDAVICDPPYGIFTSEFDKSVIDFTEMWDCLDSLVVDNGNIVLFSGGIFTHRLALSNEKKYRYDLVWKKSKCGSPFTAKYMPMKKHENILVFGNSAAYYCPQMHEGEPYKRAYTLNKTNNMNYGIRGVETDNKGTRQPDSVLDFPQKWRRQDQLHPTQKPVELMEFLCKTYCPEGGTVLDFTAGSGSTGVAALNCGMKFIGIELDDRFFDIMVDRMNMLI